MADKEKPGPTGVGTGKTDDCAGGHNVVDIAAYRRRQAANDNIEPPPYPGMVPQPPAPVCAALHRVKRLRERTDLDDEERFRLSTIWGPLIRHLDPTPDDLAFIAELEARTFGGAA